MIVFIFYRQKNKLLLDCRQINIACDSFDGKEGVFLVALLKLTLAVAEELA
tara:strand:- start:555 stop:707 length:153 start_codon:yes stop_codon:yes gene_type:complete